MDLTLTPKVENSVNDQVVAILLVRKVVYRTDTHREREETLINRLLQYYSNANCNVIFACFVHQSQEVRFLMI